MIPRLTPGLRWLRLAALLGAVAPALPGSARAEGPPAVAIVAGPRGALAARLAEELAAAGLAVRVEAEAGAAQAGEWVIVVPDGGDGAIEVWSKRPDGSALVGTIRPEGAVDTRVLRAAELVRALALPAQGRRPESGDPRGTGGPAAAAPVGPAPPTPRALGPTPPIGGAVPWPGPPFAPYGRGLAPLAPERGPATFDVDVSAAAGFSAQGASMALLTTLRLWPHDRVGVGVLVDAPLLGYTISAPEGVATMRAFLFGLELSTAPVARTSRFGVVLSPGAGFAYVDFSAEATEGLEARDASTFAALVYGRAEARFRLVAPVSLTAGGLVGGAAPPIEVHFAGQRVSTFAVHGALSGGVLLEL